MSEQVRILTTRPHRLFPSVAEELKRWRAAGRDAIVLVPEQLTVTAERMIMDALGLDGMFSPIVTSPSRLYDDLLSRIGSDGCEPLSDMGMRMSLAQSLEHLREKLPYFSASAGSRGFLEKLAALVTDMKRGGMTPEVLSRAAEAAQGEVARAKLTDLSLIYAEYEKLLRGRFSDNEDRLSYLADRLEECEYLREKQICVYGFDSLPEQLMRFLTSAAAACAGMTVALLCDGSAAPDGALYSPIREGIQRFRSMLEEKGITSVQVMLPAERLSHEPSIDWLDGHFLANRKPAAPLPPCGGIASFSAASPAAEASLMSRIVLSLLEEGVPLKKICVLYPQGAGYEFAVPAALGDAGIPFFSNRPLPALSHRLPRFLLLALRAMDSKWSNEYLLPLLHSGFAPLEYGECCELETYAFEFGIDRARWEAPFTRGRPERIERCEPLRAKLMAPLEKARAALVNAENAAQSARAVYDFLEDTGAYERLRQEEELLSQEGFLTRGAQNSQIWQTLMDLLDDAVRLNENVRIPLRRIADRLESGLAARSLSAIPPAGSLLHTGILGHMLVEEADCVFLMGLNEGILSRETESLLKPEERASAEESSGCYLGLTDENRAVLARLDLKRAMTLPAKKLFLSWASSAPNGQKLEKLSEVAAAEELFEGGIPAVSRESLPLSSVQAEMLLSSMRPDDASLAGEVWQKRLSALQNGQDGKEAVFLTAPDYAGGTLHPDQTGALYGGSGLSVSRLETFAQCPFRHYLQYGLRPVLPDEWKIDPVKLGTVTHDGMKAFSAAAKNTPAFPMISSEELNRITEESLAPVRAEAAKGVLGDGARNLAILDRACDKIRRSARAVTEQLAAGDFRLLESEFEFGKPGKYPPIVLAYKDGTERTLQGRIDRIDSCEIDGRTCLRVIDYKSSDHELEPAKIRFGLQLQLLLYLEVCRTLGENILPGGALYFHLDDPLVEQDTDDAQKAQAAIENQFGMKGLRLTDVKVLAAEDHENGVSKVYKAAGVKDSVLALDEEQLDLLLRQTKETASRLTEALFRGDSGVFPFRDGQKTACEYCDYRTTVCPFDGNRDRYHEVRALKNKDLRIQLDKELGRETEE